MWNVTNCQIHNFRFNLLKSFLKYNYATLLYFGFIYIYNNVFFKCIVMISLRIFFNFQKQIWLRYFSRIAFRKKYWFHENLLEVLKLITYLGFLNYHLHKKYLLSALFFLYYIFILIIICLNLMSRRIFALFCKWKHFLKFYPFLYNKI